VSEISVLLIGSTRRSEFREARAVLDGLGQVAVAVDAASARSFLAEGSLAPDVIVVAQSYPGQFSPEAIDQLHRAAPLARVLALLGSWCEGETRTGQPWPGAIRTYWHEWPARVAQEIARLRGGASSTWSLPVTASEEERFLLLADEPVSPREGLIAISTPDFEMHDWLRAACVRRGYTTEWLLPRRPRHVEGAIAAVFDGDHCRGREAEPLRRLAAALGRVPLIALLDFPRVGDRARARAAGARAVLSKPFLLEDLFWQIDRLVDAGGSAPD
jgi:DNA-binding NarL/FixJ family response regulator